MKELKRNEGVDILRTLLIFMILFHHIFLRNPISLRSLEIGTFSSEYKIFAFLNVFLVVAVNCFFLISGYFGIKKNNKKGIKIIISIYLIYWVVNGIFVIMNKEPIDNELIKGLIFPISQYWFLFVYLVLMFLAPYINVLLDGLALSDQRKMLMCMYILWCFYAFFIDNPILGANRGYSIVMAVIMYITGDYLKKSNLKLVYKNCFFLYLLISIVNGVCVLILLNYEKQGFVWKLYSYNNPLVVLSSVFLFLGFLKIKLKSKIKKYMKLGKYTIYVYILHSTPVFADFYMGIFEKYFTGIGLSVVFQLVILTIVLYALGIMVGLVYEKLWHILVNKKLER